MVHGPMRQKVVISLASRQGQQTGPPREWKKKEKDKSDACLWNMPDPPEISIKGLGLIDDLLEIWTFECWSLLG